MRACGPAVPFFTDRSINVEESVLLIERSTAVNIVQEPSKKMTHAMGGMAIVVC